MEIINDILDLSKIEAGQLALESVPFDLEEVLEEVARLTRAEANAKQISYLFAVPRAVPRHVRARRAGRSPLGLWVSFHLVRSIESGIGALVA